MEVQNEERPNGAQIDKNKPMEVQNEEKQPMDTQNDNAEPMDDTKKVHKSSGYEGSGTRRTSRMMPMSGAMARARKERLPLPPEKKAKSSKEDRAKQWKPVNDWGPFTRQITLPVACSKS